MINYNWLHKVINSRFVIFTMTKNIHFKNLDISYYFVKVWIIIVHFESISSHFKNKKIVKTLVTINIG